MKNLLSVYKPCCELNKTASFQGIPSVTKIVTLFVFLFVVFVSVIKVNQFCVAGFIVLCGIYILVAGRRFDVHVEMYNTSFSDCDILDKTNNLTVNVYNDAVVTINISKNTRSRYSQYVHYNYRRVYKSSVRHKRDREPSRLPTRALKRLATKSRKLRRFVFANINCIITRRCIATRV